MCLGTEAGLRLCLPEVVNIILSGLSSSSWTVKAQAGAAARTVADKLGRQLGPLHLAVLLTALVNSLAGRTWTGKVICSNNNNHPGFQRESAFRFQRLSILIQHIKTVTVRATFADTLTEDEL